MSVASRKVQPQVQQMFERYTQGNVRRLTRGDTVRMLEEEFGLSRHRAEELFDHFDKDKNGHMSMWEFNHFYNIIGPGAKEIVAKFEELDRDGKGKLDVMEAWDGVKDVTSNDPRPLEDREIEMFIKSSAGPDKHLTLGEFADMLAKIRLYQSRKK